MSRLRKDLTGKRFGKLKVIKRSTINPTNSRGNVVWDCVCDCGTEREMDSHYLLRGSSKSCGMCRVNPHFKDLSGQKFGMLTVLRQNAEEPS